MPESPLKIITEVSIKAIFILDFGNQNGFADSNIKYFDNIQLFRVVKIIG
jgi:hypothetical protein